MGVQQSYALLKSEKGSYKMWRYDPNENHMVQGNFDDVDIIYFGEDDDTPEITFWYDDEDGEEQIGYETITAFGRYEEGVSYFEDEKYLKIELEELGYKNPRDLEYYL